MKYFKLYDGELGEISKDLFDFWMANTYPVSGVIYTYSIVRKHSEAYFVSSEKNLIDKNVTHPVIIEFPDEVADVILDRYSSVPFNIYRKIMEGTTGSYHKTYILFESKKEYITWKLRI